MIPNWLMKRSYVTPHKIGLTYKEEKWTFLEMKERAHTIAMHIRGAGLQQGDRVGLMGSSSSEMVFVIHGCLLAGLEIVMINSRLTSKEIEWQLRDAEVKTSFVEDEMYETVRNLQVPAIRFSQIEDITPFDFAVQQYWDPDQTLTIMYTSGTTGNPKGVRQTAGNHTSSALSSVLNLGLSDKDVWLCTMPLFHISGFSILVRSVLYGMEVRLYEKFDATEVAKEIIEGTATRMSVVSYTLDKILSELEKNGENAHPDFQTMLAGGGPVPDQLIERAVDKNIAVLQTYGMTETSSQTATLHAEDALRKTGSAGKPLFFNDIEIKNTSSAGEIGEVMIRGPHVTPGYIGHAARVNPLENGWLPTGDLGYLDEDGFLFIVDRRSDLIISGGENIYPAEIENVLLSHPAVQEAGVCGKSHSEWGSVPAAFVILQKIVSEEELINYCQEHLAKFKVPRSIRFVDELPRNASNKLLRRELQKWIKTQ